MVVGTRAVAVTLVVKVTDSCITEVMVDSMQLLLWPQSQPRGSSPSELCFSRQFP